MRLMQAIFKVSFSIIVVVATKSILSYSYVDIEPTKGRALFFRRGSPDAVLHAGLPIVGDVPKYMALINLAYEISEGIESVF